MNKLESLRLRARTVLHLSDPADAVYVYYALFHDPHRTRLAVHEGPAGHVDGFVAVCQTGRRLFEPTVVLRSANIQVAGDLLRQALTPGRSYYVITTPDLQDAVADVVDVAHSETHHLFKLDLYRFRPAINVMVTQEEGPGGLPRFLIRSQGDVAAEAGLNWASPHFAEVFVHVASSVQRRGWGRAVLEACTIWAIRSARQPLYVVDRGNKSSIALAERVGYTDTGAREFAGEGICREQQTERRPERDAG